MIAAVRISSVILTLAMMPLLESVSRASEAIAGKIGIELNQAQDKNDACVLTFVVSNGTAADFQKIAYQVVLFDNEQRVDRMTVFNFRELSAGKTRVRQFGLSETRCESLSRLLFNDSSACEVGGQSVDFCAHQMSISSKTRIELLN